MNIDYCYRGLKEPAIYKERNNIMDTNNYTNQFNNPTTSSYSNMITGFIQGVDNEQNSQNNIWEYRGKKARKKDGKKNGRERIRSKKGNQETGARKSATMAYFLFFVSCASKSKYG